MDKDNKTTAPERAGEPEEAKTTTLPAEAPEASTAQNKREGSEIMTCPKPGQITSLGSRVLEVSEDGKLMKVERGELELVGKKARIITFVDYMTIYTALKQGARFAFLQDGTVIGTTSIVTLSKLESREVPKSERERQDAEYKRMIADVQAEANKPRKSIDSTKQSE